MVKHTDLHPQGLAQKAKCWTKLAGNSPFGAFRPENGIPGKARAIWTGVGPQNWPKPAKVAASNKMWIKKTWFYTILDANAWGMYPYFLKFPCRVSYCPAVADQGQPRLAMAGSG